MAALLASDRILGGVINCLAGRVSVGEKLGVFNEVARAANVDVLVLGSSRAFCHFDPNALPPRTLNAGMNGQGVLMARILLRLCPSRPDYVLIDPMFFADEQDRLASAHHLYGQDAVIDGILVGDSWRERLKLCSSLYAHAGVILPAIFHGWSAHRPQGPRFNPLPARSGPLAARKATLVAPDATWWSGLELLVAEVRARGATPVIVISPCADRSMDTFFDQVVSRMAGQAGVIDRRGMFPADDRHFVDTMHLNAASARAFSASLIPNLPPKKQ